MILVRLLFFFYFFITVLFFFFFFQAEDGIRDVAVTGVQTCALPILVQTSGRTQREIAGDLGIGLSTLVRWIGRIRDRRAIDPAAAESDVTAELKRLRRENELLRQERDILKKATVFFAREGSR